MRLVVVCWFVLWIDLCVSALFVCVPFAYVECLLYWCGCDLRLFCCVIGVGVFVFVLIGVVWFVCDVVVCGCLFLVCVVRVCSRVVVSLWLVMSCLFCFVYVCCCVLLVVLIGCCCVCVCCGLRMCVVCKCVGLCCMSSCVWVVLGCVLGVGVLVCVFVMWFVVV